MYRKLLTTLCFVLVLCFALSACTAGASAASDAADTLYSLGLFKGTGIDDAGDPVFELDRAPTRAEAVTMLVRLLGADTSSVNTSLPFTDVPGWAKPYVAYAYENGLTNGVSTTTFGSNYTASAAQYISFTLRALGYSSETDFKWSEAWKLSDELGLTSGQYGAGDGFTRGDVAEISLSALYQHLNGSSDTLTSRLCKTGAIKDSALAKKVLGISAFNGVSTTIAPLELHFIDVGQADSILAICGGQAMLVDGGNVADSSLIYSYLKSHNVTTLDYVVATHAHEDHVGGLAGALNFAAVKAAFCPVSDYDSEAFRNFTSALEKQGISVSSLPLGGGFILGDACVTVFGPLESYDDVNNSSIVLRIDHGEKSFLLMGDAELESETDILNSSYDVDVDLIKIGHHGSESSTGYRLLYAASPKYAVISCGANNSYGHPDEAVLSRLRDAEVKLYRTDMQGHIVCVSNGRSLNITTERNTGINTNPTQNGETATPTPSPAVSTQPTVETTPQPSEVPSVQTQSYIGNRNSYIFHRPSCSSLPMEKNRVYFTTRQGAVDAGFSPCQRCNP